MLGVQRDGQDADGKRLKTLNFGPEGGKTTAQLAAEVAHVRKVRPDLKIVADAAPDNWTFLEEFRPDEEAVDFFHACEHLSEVGDRRDRLVRQASRHPPRRREGRHKVAIRYLRDRATTKAAVAVARAFPQAPAPHAVREPQGQGLRLPASSANKVLVNQRRARWGVRPKRPHLQGDVGPLRRRVAAGTRGANDGPNAPAA